MIKIKINKNILEVEPSELRPDYLKAGHSFPEPTRGEFVGMEGYDPKDNSLGYEKGPTIKEQECEIDEESSCGCDSCMSEELQVDIDEELLYEKKDRCYYLAKQKYDVFPSAYASGFIVRCRKGKVGRKKIRIKKRRKNEEIDFLSEGTFDKEKKSELHGWFSRAGGEGKSKGWVDCNTCRTNPKTGRKTCKSCGRQAGEKRSKYPACRPTPSACTRAGMRRKKSSIRVSWKKKKKVNEEVLNENVIRFLQDSLQKLKSIIPGLDIKSLLTKANEIINAYREIKNLKSQNIQEAKKFGQTPLLFQFFNKYGILITGLALALMQVTGQGGQAPEPPNELAINLIKNGLSGISAKEFVSKIGPEEASQMAETFLL